MPSFSRMSTSCSGLMIPAPESLLKTVVNVLLEFLFLNLFILTCVLFTVFKINDKKLTIFIQLLSIFLFLQH